MKTVSGKIMKTVRGGHYLRRIPLHPFLFGCFFVLAIYSANVKEISPSQVLLPLVVTFVGISAILFLAWLLLRNVGQAALVTSASVILCFSYGHVVNLLTPTLKSNFNFFSPVSDLAVLLWVIWIWLIGANLWLVWKRRPNPTRLTAILNIVGISLIIMPLFNIAINEARKVEHTAIIPDVIISAPTPSPDIYYIILDRYASASILKERFEFDNSEFIDYLSSKRFYVAQESRDNYVKTEYSLASSLNMEYLDGLSGNDREPLYAMLQDYKIWRLLTTVDYEFIHVGGWWEPTRENKYADININYGGSLPEFSRLLLKTTALEMVGRITHLWGDQRRIQYERVKYEFDRISEIPSIDKPTFTFAHFLTPHPDYVFKDNGDFLPLNEEVKTNWDALYLDQLKATNQLVMSCIDKLIANSHTPPIIILQSDEGPYPDGLGDTSFVASAKSDIGDLKMKTGILNAYYFPNVDHDFFYPSLTPVNSFRILFNLYFGTDFELLADRIYAISPSQPYTFIDLTPLLLTDFNNATCGE